jgi:single-stranded-DNA-specific exonuclease
VQATLSRGREMGAAPYAAVQEGWEKWLLDLVAIATVADMVPLIGENRALVFWGREVLRKSPRPGLIALCRLLRLKKSELSEDDIGFSIAPRINAASRMDTPELALALLTTRDALEAERIAKELDKLNQSRKGVVASIVREARTRMKERYENATRVAVLGDITWKPSLLGLAANSLVGDRGGVVCLWGRDALGALKGSCRSDGTLSVVELFSAAGDALSESGGHEMSGGFSIAEGRVHTLHEVFAHAAESIVTRVAVAPSNHDAHVHMREVGEGLLREIACLAPFGVGNPRPVFRLARVEVSDVRRFGKEKNHIELALTCQESGMKARGYDFFRSAEDFSVVPEAGVTAEVLATLERDTFRGGIALRLVDLVTP